MIAPLAKSIDWSVLQMAHAIIKLRPVPEAKWRLAEALELLNGPDSFPAVSQPARIEFCGPRNFKFPTPRPCQDEENNIVYGRLYRCAERWRERPAIIFLDGNPAVGYHFAFPLVARWLNRAGFNMATLIASYHLKRRPRRSLEWSCLAFARVMTQNVAEIRALTGWLLDEGCPSVGIVGFSFGGYLAGLIACSDPRIACAVLTVPAVRLTTSQSAVSRRRREALDALRPAQEAIDTTRLNLLLSQPVIPKENILLIEGINDLFAPRQPIEDLWQKWQQPEIWRLPHGHISALFVPGLTRRVLDWPAPRLNRPFKPDRGTRPNTALGPLDRRRGSALER